LTLLDAYALIAFLAAGPASSQVRAILRDGDAAVATANLVEALDVSQRVRGVPIERIRHVIDPLLEGPVHVVPLDLEIARRAATLRARHYHARTCAISLADAVLLASATAGDRIATADPAVLAVARHEQLRVFALPDKS
jgi:PIN domain nuclease of toxin-antitoxin system